MSKRKDGVKNQHIMPGVSLRGRYLKKEPVRVEKVERNAPCACGSGLKHKHCCGAGPKGIWQRLRWFFSGRER